MEKIKKARGVPLPHLEAWRLHNVLTQEELAEQSGVSRTTIGTAEARASSVRLSSVRKLAAALGIDAATLIRHAPAEAPAEALATAR